MDVDDDAEEHKKSRGDETDVIEDNAVDIDGLGLVIKSVRSGSQMDQVNEYGDELDSKIGDTSYSKSNGDKARDIISENDKLDDTLYVRASDDHH